jgi:hypothetical protein
MGLSRPLRGKARSTAAPSHPCFGAVARNLANRTGCAARAIGKSRSGRQTNSVLRGNSSSPLVRRRIRRPDYTEAA